MTMTGGSAAGSTWRRSPVVIPRAGLPRLLVALAAGDDADAVVDFGYDWLPLWITPHVTPGCFT